MATLFKKPKKAGPESNKKADPGKEKKDGKPSESGQEQGQKG